MATATKIDWNLLGTTPSFYRELYAKFKNINIEDVDENSDEFKSYVRESEEKFKKQLEADTAYQRVQYQAKLRDENRGVFVLSRYYEATDIPLKEGALYKYVNGVLTELVMQENGENIMNV